MNVIQALSIANESSGYAMRGQTDVTRYSPVTVLGSYSIIIACLVTGFIIGYVWYRAMKQKNIEDFDSQDWLVFLMIGLIVSAALQAGVIFAFNLTSLYT